MTYNEPVIPTGLPFRFPRRATIVVALLCALGATAVAQPVTSGAGSGAPAPARPRAESPRAVTAQQRYAADVATAVENMLVTLLADYEYQLGRGIVFQSQGWYPTFSLLHAEEDIAVRWEGDRVTAVTITLAYAKRGLDSGQLLPEQTGFLLPEAEAWFLAVTARRIVEAVEKTGRGSPSVTWEVRLPQLDAEGDMVWEPGLSVTVTPSESKADPQGLSDRIRQKVTERKGTP